VAKDAQLIDSREAAAKLGVSLRRVQQFIASGRLPATRLGGNYVIRSEDLAKVRDRPTGRPPKAKGEKPKRSKGK
jgi:excisionase family DNA binding protein